LNWIGEEKSKGAALLIQCLSSAFGFVFPRAGDDYLIFANLSVLTPLGTHKFSVMWFTHRMDRYVLTDAQWARMEPHCLGKPTDPGRSGSDNRRFVEAVLWIARSGSPWRDLPAMFGNWSTAFRRFSDWRKADVFKHIFDACSDEPDMEYAMVDATIVKVHRHGQGAIGGHRARP
jgi:transposase